MTARSVRPAFRRVAVAACIVLLPVAAHAVWDYVELQRLVAEIDIVKSSGDPVTRRELVKWNSRLDDDEQASARYYRAAAALAFQDRSLSNPAASLPLQDPVRLARVAADAIGSSRVVSREAEDRLAKLAAQYGEALAMMDKANALRFLGFGPRPDEDYRRTYSLEDLAVINMARTIAAAAKENARSASESFRGSLLLRRAHIRTVPWIGEPLLELQVLLEHTDPAVDDLASLQQHVREREAPDAVEATLRAERARTIEDALFTLYGRGADPLVHAENVRWSWRPLVTRPWVVHRLVASLRRQREAINAALTEWPRKLTALDDLAARHPAADPTVIQVFDRGGSHAASVARQSAVRLALLRSGGIALAVERFRREHGALPESLQALVPAYLAAVPSDPFDAAPLRYRRAEHEYAIYSVGRNGKDDGGQVTPLTYAPSGAANDVGIEIRMRVPGSSRTDTARASREP